MRELNAYNYITTRAHHYRVVCIKSHSCRRLLVLVITRSGRYLRGGGVCLFWSNTGQLRRKFHQHDNDVKMVHRAVLHTAHWARLHVIADDLGLLGSWWTGEERVGRLLRLQHVRPEPHHWQPSVPQQLLHGVRLERARHPARAAHRSRHGRAAHRGTLYQYRPEPPEFRPRHRRPAALRGEHCVMSLMSVGARVSALFVKFTWFVNGTYVTCKDIFWTLNERGIEIAREYRVLPGFWKSNDTWRLQGLTVDGVADALTTTAVISNSASLYQSNTQTCIYSTDSG